MFNIGKERIALFIEFKKKLNALYETEKYIMYIVNHHSSGHK